MTSAANLANADAITAFLAGKGLSPAQIAGVEGNWVIESGGRPTASNPGEGAIGLAQWEGGRRTALDAYAKQTGGAETDLQTQLGFWWQEMNTTEHASLVALSQATTPAQAATVFDQQYERSSSASLPARVAAAQQIAAGGLQGGPGLAVGGSGSGSVQTAGWNPLGDAASGIASGIADGLGPILKPLGHFVVDALLVLAGVGLIITGAIILGRDAHEDDKARKAVDKNDPGHQWDDGRGDPPPEPAAPAHHHRAVGAAEAGGEDAAEVAVVA